MEKRIDQFLETLKQTQRLYEKLLEMVRQERTTVLRSKVDQLNALLVEKEGVLVQLAVLEKKRLYQLEQLADQLGLPVQQLTLSKLAAMASKHHARQINRLRIGLRRLINDLAKVNAESRSMVNHCLALVNGALRFLQHCIKPPSVYVASGDMDSRNNSGQLIKGAV